jgi:hypothetical protein
MVDLYLTYLPGSMYLSLRWRNGARVILTMCFEDSSILRNSSLSELPNRKERSHGQSPLQPKRRWAGRRSPVTSSGELALKQVIANAVVELLETN